MNKSNQIKAKSSNNMENRVVFIRGKVGWRDARKWAHGGQHGTGKESDLQRNTEPGP